MVTLWLYPQSRKVYSDADQRKHQSSALLAFVRGIHRWPVNSPHKWPVTRKIFPFDDVIMGWQQHNHQSSALWRIRHWLWIPFTKDKLCGKFGFGITNIHFQIGAVKLKTVGYFWQNSAALIVWWRGSSRPDASMAGRFKKIAMVQMDIYTRHPRQ